VNVDEKIYSLMAVAQDQQKLTLEFINEQKREIEALKNERAEISSQHQKNMAEIKKIARNRISLMWVFTTSIGCAVCAALIGYSATFYLKSTLMDIAEAKSAYEDLRGFDADIKFCTREGVEYPCVRVMTKWGAYQDEGSNVSDLYILDRK